LPSILMKIGALAECMEIDMESLLFPNVAGDGTGQCRIAPVGAFSRKRRAAPKVP
jgi:hypothetical protein